MPPKLVKQFKVCHMSVCVAALAAESRAIVCVADKALSYGGYIQWDSDSSKMLALDRGSSLVMFSDNGNGPSVLEQFRGAAVSGKPLDTIIADCGERYAKAEHLLIEARFLRPRLLNKSLYVNAITAPQVNDLLRSLADEIRGFDMECDLLVCGFDRSDCPFILDVESPGAVSDLSTTGFQAIGSGSEKAISRLLFSESKRSHPIERVLYEVFDAKANAEMAVGVGYEWDAKILVLGKQPIEVPERIKKVIEKVWTCQEQSPFDLDVDEEDVPPKTWKSILKKFADECLSMPSTSQTSAGQQ